MKILAVIERDLRRFTRNPIMLISSIVLPIVYLVIIGYSFQGELKNLTCVVVNQDHGPYGRRVIELMQAVNQGPMFLQIEYSSNSKEAYNLVKNGLYKALLIIPSDFSRDVIKNNNPELGLFLDNTDSVSANAISQIITRSLNYIKKEYSPIRAESSIIKLKLVELFKKIDYAASLVPGAIVMAIFMGTMITGAFNLVMDKFLGIHESYLSTPLTKKDITIGIIISGVLITTIMTQIVLISGMLITGLKLEGGFQSYILVLFIIILSSLGLLSMMFIILGRANHPRVVGLIGGFLNVIFFFPSGAVYPIESFPNWLRAFAKVNPEAYTVHALKEIIFKGSNFFAIKNDVIFLFIFTLLMLLLATFSFKRTL